ncbi:beta-propeller fold lactonase family protein, partial [Cellulomonas fimi]|uniref:beta-propeller fold lactonase family protein n=1 Tax=Cellulomonas fimi TaxID=1708 RepID=UPI0035D552A8
MGAGSLVEQPRVQVLDELVRLQRQLHDGSAPQRHDHGAAPAVERRDVEVLVRGDARDERAVAGEVQHVDAPVARHDEQPVRRERHRERPAVREGALPQQVARREVEGSEVALRGRDRRVRAVGGDRDGCRGVRLPDEHPQGHGVAAVERHERADLRPLAPGTGPRHLAFAADGRTLYVVGELDV